MSGTWFLILTTLLWNSNSCMTNHCQRSNCSPVKRYLNRSETLWKKDSTPKWSDFWIWKSESIITIFPLWKGRWRKRPNSFFIHMVPMIVVCLFFVLCYGSDVKRMYIKESLYSAHFPKGACFYLWLWIHVKPQTLFASFLQGLSLIARKCSYARPRKAVSIARALAKL